MGEKTFVMIKPDGVRRKLVGEIIHRLERVGLELKAMRLDQLSREKAEEHYHMHRGKPFFDGLIKYVTSGPVVLMVWEGPNAIEVVRKLVGATDPVKAAAGTIRGDFALTIDENIVHASDSPETAAEEIKRFFNI